MPLSHLRIRSITRNTILAGTSSNCTIILTPVANKTSLLDLTQYHVLRTLYTALISLAPKNSVCCVLVKFLNVISTTLNFIRSQEKLRNLRLDCHRIPANVILYRQQGFKFKNRIRQHLEPLDPHPIRPCYIHVRFIVP